MFGGSLLASLGDHGDIPSVRRQALDFDDSWGDHGRKVFVAGVLRL
jgi:hypothetical protein